MDEENLPRYKLVILSNYESGKTSIIYNYIGLPFKVNTPRTTGPTFFVKNVILNNGKKIKLEIWDTPTGERYMALRKVFVKDCKGAIFLYDISNRRSFEDIEQTHYYYRDYLFGAVVALVGNKIDLEYDSYRNRVIGTEEGERLANKMNCLFFEVSAKNGTNINEFFNTLAQRIYENDPNTEEERRILNENEIKLKNNRTPKKGCLK